MVHSVRPRYILRLSERPERSFHWSVVWCLCGRPSMTSAKERWSWGVVPTGYWWHCCIHYNKQHPSFPETYWITYQAWVPFPLSDAEEWMAMAFRIIFGIVVQYLVKFFIKVLLSRLMFRICMLWWVVWGCFSFFWWCIGLGGWWWFLAPLGPDSHWNKHLT